MSMEPRHFQEAEARLPDTFAEHSAAYREGFTYALAWAIAGRPAATPERSKDRDCPYGAGSPERDAWFYGWGNGFRHAQREGLLPPD